MNWIEAATEPAGIALLVLLGLFAVAVILMACTGGLRMDGKNRY